MRTNLPLWFSLISAVAGCERDATIPQVLQRLDHLRIESRITASPSPRKPSHPDQVGVASYYATGSDALTAAHPTLPMGTMVRVTNQRNHRSVVVEVTDRGPYVKKRIIDLSTTAAKVLDMVEAGLVPVRVQRLPDYVRPEAGPRRRWYRAGRRHRRPEPLAD